MNFDTETSNSVHGSIILFYFYSSNGAFSNMDEETKENIFEDKVLATKVVKHHILKEMLCCSGITRNFM